MKRELPEKQTMLGRLRNARHHLRALQKDIRPLVKEMDRIAEILNNLAGCDHGDFESVRNYDRIEKKYAPVLKQYHELRNLIYGLAGSMEE